MGGRFMIDGKFGNTSSGWRVFPVAPAQLCGIERTSCVWNRSPPADDGQPVKRHDVVVSHDP